MKHSCLVCGHKSLLYVKDLFDDRYGAPGKHNIYRCTNCGFGRIDPALKPSQIGAFYAKYYPLAVETPQSVKAAAKILPKWKRWLSGTDNTTHHYTKPGMRVLDIGSASGVSLLEIQQLGGHAYGVEPDPTAGKLARKLNLNVFTGFITDNPFPKEKFDFITASQVIEHTPQPEAFLKAVAKKLNTNGQAVLAFPNFDAFYRKLFGRRWLHWHIPYHYNFFTRGSFERLAKKTGLRVVKTRTVTPNLWTIIQLRMLSSAPIEGTMGAVWAAQHGKKSSQPPPFMVRLVQQVSLRFLSGLIVVFNRSIDRFGKGESFLVFLEKSDKK